MASPMVTRIKDAADRAWPEVSRALRHTTLSVAEVAGVSDDAIEQVESYVSNHERGTWKRRQICAETVWALARIGRLRTGGEAELLKAAQRLVDGPLRDFDEGELEPEEKQLIAAVRALPGWE
jgi:hypothetical protein